MRAAFGSNVFITSLLHFYYCHNILIITTTFHRKKLGELDSIQRYLNRKLSANAIQSVSQNDCSDKSEPQGEQDSRQLMQQSRQLVGEVSSVISGELQFILAAKSNTCSWSDQKSTFKLLSFFCLIQSILTKCRNEKSADFVNKPILGKK